MGEFFMNVLDYLLILVEEANTPTLFFALVFGVVLAPINRESIIVFMAILAAANAINPVVSFVITTTATYIGYSLGFFVGRGFKGKVFKNPSERTQKKLERSYQLLERYGNRAIIVSYFIPGARHFLPVILGTGNMTLTQFMLTSQVGSIIWTSAFFLPGYFLGDTWTSIFL
ncbi:MAG: DedA family protein [Bacillota bacterium]|nr:DedA family protein [Bacillota bacterium]